MCTSRLKEWNHSSKRRTISVAPELLQRVPRVLTQPPAQHCHRAGWVRKSLQQVHHLLKKKKNRKHFREGSSHNLTGIKEKRIYLICWFHIESSFTVEILDITLPSVLLRPLDKGCLVCFFFFFFFFPAVLYCHNQKCFSPFSSVRIGKDSSCGV